MGVTCRRSWVQAVESACRRELGMPSDCKLQSASDMHGHQVDHVKRHVGDGIELRNAREPVKKGIKSCKSCRTSSSLAWMFPRITDAG